MKIQRFFRGASKVGACSNRTMSLSPDEQPLLGHRYSSSRIARARDRSTVWLAIAGLAVFAGAAAFLNSAFSTKTYHGKGVTEEETLSPLPNDLVLVSAANGMVGIKARNRRIEKDGTLRSQALYEQKFGLPGGSVAILEPFLETTFFLTDPMDATLSWHIERRDEDQGDRELDLAARDGMRRLDVRGAGSEFVHTFTELGVHRISLEVVEELSDGTNSPTREKRVKHITARVLLRYVRREIRSVTEEDRVNVMEAFRVLAEVDDRTGVERFGSNYRSLRRLSSEHNNWSGKQDCDHLHDGMGYLPLHLALTRQLEASLQSVDASVALPYWEYVYDVERLKQENKTFWDNWGTIDIFSDEWFGRTNLYTGELEGNSYFSKLTVTADSNFTIETNSYGLIRSPWNNDPATSFRRYIGPRTGHWTDTLENSTHYEQGVNSYANCALLCEAMKAADLEQFSLSFPGLVHGSIHLMTGGSSVLGAAISNELAKEWVTSATWGVIPRMGYRYGYWQCPDACSADTPREDCTCSCDSDNTYYHGLDVEYACESSMILGDASTSSGANDPSFWSMHGTLERYFQYSLSQGWMYSLTWPNCTTDYSDCVFADNLEPSTVTHCYGHDANDLILFGEVDGMQFTNIEYVDYLANTMGLPYVYDSFDWEFCSDWADIEVSECGHVSAEQPEGANTVAPPPPSTESLVKEFPVAALSADESKQPHIILFTVDDMGWNDIGYTSTDLPEATEYMVKLAKKSVKLTHYYTQPSCTPSRVTIMTGKWAYKNGFQNHEIHPSDNIGVPLSNKLMPEHMQDLGYKTHGFGKWNIGHCNEKYLPQERGFNHFLGYLGPGHGYRTFDSGMNAGLKDMLEGFSSLDAVDGERTTSWTTGAPYEGVYDTQLYQDFAAETIRAHSKAYGETIPLFLWSAQHGIHAEFDSDPIPPDSMLTQSNKDYLEVLDLRMKKCPEGSEDKRFFKLRKITASVLMSIDNSLKHLVETLEEADMLRNTVLFVHSDNGGDTEYTKGHPGNNFPLRSEKFGYFEGGVRVPAFVFAPGRITEERMGTQFHGLMHHVDLLTTFVGLGGGDVSSTSTEHGLDGYDMWPAIRGEVTGPRSEVVLNMPRGTTWKLGQNKTEEGVAIRMGNYKMLLNHAVDTWFSPDPGPDHQFASEMMAAFCQYSFYTTESDTSQCEFTNFLFDLSNDPHERTNLWESDDHDSIRKSMIDRIYELLSLEEKDYGKIVYEYYMLPQDDYSKAFAASGYYIVPWDCKVIK